MTRHTTLTRIAVPTAILALSLTACKGEGGNSAKPDESGTPSAVPTEKWNPGKDPDNHAPSDATKDEESVKIKMTKGEASLTVGVEPRGVNKKESANGKTPFTVTSLISYVKGDRSLMEYVPASLTLYSDTKSPEPVAITGGSKIKQCHENTKKALKQIREKTTDTAWVCTPFLLDKENAAALQGKEGPVYHVGIFDNPGAEKLNIAKVWTVDNEADSEVAQ